MRVIQYFSLDVSNRGRQDELDIVKGLAIIFMVWDHVYRDMGADTHSPIGYLIDAVLGGPFAAPMFMICLGIGIQYSRHSAPELLVKRGLMLIFIGYILNFFRDTVPQFIEVGMTSRVSFLNGWEGKLLNVDILQFAGLAFIAIGGLRKLGLKDWRIVGVACLLSIIGTVLKDVATGNGTLDLVLGLFWKTQDQADFPFFYWFIFPAAGLVMGGLLTHCTDKHVVYRKVMPIALILSLLIEGIATLFDVGMASQFTEYFYLTLISATAVSIFALFWFGFNDWWHTRFDSISIKTLQRFSKNITSIYVVSWLLIGALQVIKAMTWQDTQIGFWSATALAITVLILSDMISRYYHSWQLHRKAV